MVMEYMESYSMVHIQGFIMQGLGLILRCVEIFIGRQGRCRRIQYFQGSL